MHAFVLIQADPGPEPLAPSLRGVPGVMQADEVQGAFDAIVLAQAASTRELLEGVIARILMLPRVRRALPAPAIASVGGETAGPAAAA